MKRSISLVVGVLAIFAVGATRSKPIVHRTPTPASVPRDAHGKIKRDPKATAAFKKQTGYPHGRPGYVIDHVVPLKRGGTDKPSNMQWQTKAAAKAKDRTE